jgi:putative ABC transport system permease protein
MSRNSFLLRYRESLLMAIQSLSMHKTRSLLTMLGIIFGVGAVIAMLSIGEGARQEALEQIEVLGVRNVIIRAVQAEASTSGDDASNNRAMGITTKDASALSEICDFAERVTVSWETKVDARTYEGHAQTTLIGTTPSYGPMFNVRLSDGHFLLPYHLETRANVCVIGSEVSRALFGFRDPVQQMIKLQSQWFTVIGVMEAKKVARTGELSTAMSNDRIYIPLTTAMSKFPREMSSTMSFFGGFGRFRMSRGGGGGEFLDRSTIDQITVQVNEDIPITEASRVISRILQKRHNGQKDFTITIPEELIRQQQKTQSIFNVVMGAIAGISLLVGGIGIMNIMLASVLERTREIGIRRAIGATKRMVVIQFLAEAVMLSVIGGIIGIGIGWGLTGLITAYAGWRTIIRFWSMALAFTVAAATGIGFGFYPARQASEKDVIESLRYE